MALFKSAHPGEILEDILDREKEAVLSGNLDALHGMVAEKAAVINRIRQDRLTESRLEILRRKARRNRALLEAAQKGIASVLRQMRTPSGPARSFQTYDVNGTSRKLESLKRNGLEKRA